MLCISAEFVCLGYNCASARLIAIGMNLIRSLSRRVGDADNRKGPHRIERTESLSPVGRSSGALPDAVARQRTASATAIRPAPDAVQGASDAPQGRRIRRDAPPLVRRPRRSRTAPPETTPLPPDLALSNQSWSQSTPHDVVWNRRRRTLKAGDTDAERDLASGRNNAAPLAKSSRATDYPATSVAGQPSPSAQRTSRKTVVQQTYEAVSPSKPRGRTSIDIERQRDEQWAMEESERQAALASGSPKKKNPLMGTIPAIPLAKLRPTKAPARLTDSQSRASQRSTRTPEIRETVEPTVAPPRPASRRTVNPASPSKLAPPSTPMQKARNRISVYGTPEGGSDMDDVFNDAEGGDEESESSSLSSSSESELSSDSSDESQEFCEFSDDSVEAARPIREAAASEPPAVVPVKKSPRRDRDAERAEEEMRRERARMQHIEQQNIVVERKRKVIRQEQERQRREREERERAREALREKERARKDEEDRVRREEMLRNSRTAAERNALSRRERADAELRRRVFDEEKRATEALEQEAAAAAATNEREVRLAIERAENEAKEALQREISLGGSRRSDETKSGSQPGDGYSAYATDELKQIEHDAGVRKAELAKIEKERKESLNREAREQDVERTKRQQRVKEVAERAAQDKHAAAERVMHEKQLAAERAAREEQEAIERALREKHEATERAAHEKQLAMERALREKELAERAAREKKAAAERAELEQKEAAERAAFAALVAAEREEREKLERAERAEREKKERAERAEREKKERAERAEREKKERAERAEREKKERAERAEAERIERERQEAENAARAAEEQRLAEEAAIAERIRVAQQHQQLEERAMKRAKREVDDEDHLVRVAARRAESAEDEDDSSTIASDDVQSTAHSESTSVFSRFSLSNVQIVSSAPVQDAIKGILSNSPMKKGGTLRFADDATPKAADVLVERHEALTTFNYVLENGAPRGPRIIERILSSSLVAPTPGAGIQIPPKGPYREQGVQYFPGFTVHGLADPESQQVPAGVRVWQDRSGTTLASRLVADLDMVDIRTLMQTSRDTRAAMLDECVRESAARRFLAQMGYQSWEGVDPLPITLLDLEAFIVYQSVRSEFRAAAHVYITRGHRLDRRIPRMARASLRAHAKILARLRICDATPPTSIWMPMGTLESPFSHDRAALFFVWTPEDDNNAWTAGTGLQRAERELFLAGVWRFLRTGDVVYNITKVDNYNDGRYIFCNDELTPLHTKFDPVGHLPPVIDMFQHTPMYYRDAVRYSGMGPIVYLDILPFRSEIMRTLHLSRENVETASGNRRYRVSKWVYRASAELLVPTDGSDTSGTHPAWNGGLEIIIEGTAEHARELVRRCISPTESPALYSTIADTIVSGEELPDDLPPAKLPLDASGNRVPYTFPWRIMDDRSQIGLIWISMV